MARSRSVGSRRTVRLGSYGAERGEGRSGRGHRCVPGLLQEGPGGVHKGDGIRQQTEGREKQQGAGDGAREDVPSQAFDLPCRREAKDLTPSAALPRADALGVGGWGGPCTQASQLQPGAQLASDAFLPRPGPLAPKMPLPADPAPPRPGKAPPPQPGMLKGGPGSPAVHVL